MCRRRSDRRRTVVERCARGRDAARLRALLDLPLDDVTLAQLAQRAEVQHAGVQLRNHGSDGRQPGRYRQALFLDTRTLERRRVPLPTDSAVLVLDSGITRSLATSAFNQRRAECEEAARQLGVRALRDIDAGRAVEARHAAEPWRSRARHVVTENARVLRAVECSDPTQFGALMNASHASLRDDFDVSVPALDRLVALLQADPDVYGARLTGAGFGGACVALCRSVGTVAHQCTGAERLRARRIQRRGLVPPA